MPPPKKKKNVISKMGTDKRPGKAIEDLDKSPQEDPTTRIQPKRQKKSEHKVLGASPVKQFSTEFDVVDDERMNENIFSKKRNFEITREPSPKRLKIDRQASKGSGGSRKRPVVVRATARKSSTMKSNSSSSSSRTPAPSLCKQDCRVEVMNLTSQRRIGLAVKLLLSRVGTKDELALPASEISDQNFDPRFDRLCEERRLVEAEFSDEEVLPLLGELADLVSIERDDEDEDPAEWINQEAEVAQEPVKVPALNPPSSYVIELSPDVTLTRGKGEDRRVLQPPPPPPNKNTMRIKNSKLLLPSGDISAVGDFSNVPNIMASSKPATGRKKDNYDDPGLPSPDDSLPLRDWLKELLWARTSAAITASLNNKNAKNVKKSKTTQISKVRASQLSAVKLVSLHENLCTIQLKDGSKLQGTSIRGYSRWFSVPVIGKNFYYNMTTNKIYDNASISPQFLEEFKKNERLDDDDENLVDLNDDVANQDYQVDEDDISMDEEEVGNGFGSQKKRKPKSSGERNSPPSSGKQSSSQSIGKQTSPQSSGKRIFHLRSDKRTSSPSSGKRACLVSSAKQPSQNADIRASLVNKDAPSDKAIGLMVASSSIMCGINEKAGRCMQLISKELFENHVFKNHRSIALDKICFFDGSNKLKTLSNFGSRHKCIACPRLFLSMSESINEDLVLTHWRVSHKDLTATNKKTVKFSICTSSEYARSQKEKAQKAKGSKPRAESAKKTQSKEPQPEEPQPEEAATAEEKNLVCTNNNCNKIVPHEQFGIHLFQYHANIAPGSVRFKDDCEDQVLKSLTKDFAFCLKCKECHRLFLSRKPITRETVNSHWNMVHKKKAKHTSFSERVMTLSDGEGGLQEGQEDPLQLAVDSTIQTDASELPAKLAITRSAKGVRRDDAHTHTQKARPLDSELEWNVKLVTDLLEFFGPYIELSTKNSLKDDVNRKKPEKSEYADRKAVLRTDGIPKKDENGEYVNESYCTQMYHSELTQLLANQMGGLEETRVLVAQQFSFVNNVKCIERVHQYKVMKTPSVSVTIKTYKCPKTLNDKRMCNVIVSNNLAASPSSIPPGLVPTRVHNRWGRELHLVSQCLSNIETRSIAPSFDSRGIIMNQQYCSSNTYAEVMAGYWENFLNRVPGVNDKVQIEKIQLSSFGKTNITDFAQPISLNGVMAVPRKKEFSRSFPANLSLYVNFTFFDTGGTTASLALTLVRVQWFKSGAPVDSSGVDLPAMNTADTLIDYIRMGTKLKGYKSCYKTTEISVMEETRVLVNEKGVPRNQAMFVNEMKTKVMGDLKLLVGPLTCGPAKKTVKSKPMELYIGGSVYTGKATVCRRKFPEFPYDLVVMIASCRFVMDFNDPESKPNGFPDKFTQAEISWVEREWNRGHPLMVEDHLIPAWPRYNGIHRTFPIKMDPEMCAIVEKLGARCTAIRFKLIHKYDLATSRPEPRKLIGSISRKGYGNTKRSEVARQKIAAKARQEAADTIEKETLREREKEDEAAAAAQAIATEDPLYYPQVAKKKRTSKSRDGGEDSDDDDDGDEDDVLWATYVAKLKDELVYFESYFKMSHPITYNKRDQKGILMVQSSKSLLHALIGSATTVNAGWIPSPVEVEMYEPKLTNAYMTFTVFALPNIVHRKNGRPKLCLGPVALSTSNTGDDAALLGEHLKYNNDNVTRIQSIAACNDEIFHSLRNGLKALNCLYIYDENSVLNSATNRAKNLKNWIKDTEIALSAELGALRVSWEVYMSRVISLRQESDMADIFLALSDNDDFTIADPEAKRLFCLDDLEKSQLDEDELRCYETEFFEWLGLGTYPSIPWREYVLKKLSEDPSFVRKTMSEDDLMKWNQDLSFDNQFFGNLVLQSGTLSKTPKAKPSKKRKTVKVHDVTQSPEKFSRESADFVTADGTPFSDFNRVEVDGTFENVVFTNTEFR